VKKILLGSLAFVIGAFSADTVPNSFSSGDVIKASEINANYDFLSSKITELRAQIEALQSQEKTFVGVSTTTHDGDDGIMAMNNSCNSAFAGSTMCTSEEIRHSTNTNLSGTGYAWILPTYSGVFYSSAAGIFDISGVGMPSLDTVSMSCVGWSTANNSYTGLTTSLPNGIIKQNNCSIAYPVACCR